MDSQSLEHGYLIAQSAEHWYEAKVPINKYKKVGCGDSTKRDTEIPLVSAWNMHTTQHCNIGFGSKRVAPGIGATTQKGHNWKSLFLTQRRREILYQLAENG